MTSRNMTYVQVLMNGGYVHDVSPETWEIVKQEAGESFSKWVTFEDIYGGTIELRMGNVDSTRLYSPETGAKWRELHPPHEEDADGYLE